MSAEPEGIAKPASDQDLLVPPSRTSSSPLSNNKTISRASCASTASKGSSAKTDDSFAISKRQQTEDPLRTYTRLFSAFRDTCDAWMKAKKSNGRLHAENEQLKQRLADLEGNGTLAPVKAVVEDPSQSMHERVKDALVWLKVSPECLEKIFGAVLPVVSAKHAQFSLSEGGQQVGEVNPRKRKRKVVA
ncbi:hypothetical protein EJ03DRAFT_65788 [Teratosphaeria nubilosa]|uniref:Uncharacterized protein n=1 Tax=Teratosphaeria nubilosa TaxID=161662 RepID=A0A6G1LCL9_9PEZI|nr:hypothetical protein EJ03DRAFT_65788 [Teratosphaeria nubilosa]